MQKEVKTCVFCNQQLTTKTQSKEHVWTRWLQRRLGLEKRQFEGLHSGIPWGISIISKRRQSAESLVLGGICTACNNGWMSELENNVAPLFENLWNSNGSKYKILESDSCKVLAHWAFKTSLVINLSSNYKRIVPPEHYQEFYLHRQIPKNTVLDVSLAPFKENLSWIQGQTAFGGLPDGIEITKQLAMVLSSLYVITLDVGGILYPYIRLGPRGSNNTVNLRTAYRGLMGDEPAITHGKQSHPLDANQALYPQPKGLVGITCFQISHCRDQHLLHHPVTQIWVD